MGEVPGGVCDPRQGSLRGGGWENSHHQGGHLNFIKKDLILNFLGFPWVFPSWSPAAGARQAMDWAGTH